MSDAPHPATPNPQSPLPFPRFIHGDSSVFNDLRARLDHRQKETAPEKLYFQFDRTLYQPGETAWFSAYVRNAGDLLPSLQSQFLYVELTGPSGAVVQQKNLLALFGTAAGEFDFPATLPGGIYKVRAWTRWMQNTSEVFERSLTLQKVVLPNLNLKLEFERKAFGAGDVAIARFDAFSLDNKALANQKVGFTAMAGGKPFAEGEALTDANGRAYVRFQLPEKLESADGLLNVQIEHEGQQEAISRAIPIVLNKIDLQFFPEGGDAVAGIPCRMAFKAVNEFGKPADVEGAVYDSRGTQVALFGSYHNGMGAFDFLPQAGERYEARLSKPFASGKAFALPEAQNAGYSLRLQRREADGLTLEVSASRLGKVYLTGMSRDKLFFFKELNFETNSPAQIVVPTRDLPVGIARFTLFDKNKTEQAERLAFVNRDRGLKIELKTDKPEYLPREKVNLRIRVSDHAGRPVGGNFSLAVSDENLLAFADDKQGHLLSSLLLEQDVKGKVEEPNFYFDPAEPKSEQALDYLLMTQGWRRFEWKKVLENQTVAYQYAPERAIVEGQVFGRKGKPWANATVSLYPGGPSVQTDKEGRYSFGNVDLEKYSHLQYGGSEYQPINGYSSNVMLHSYKNTDPNSAKLYSWENPDGTTVVSGTIVDEIGEPLIGATVKLMKDGKVIRNGITDWNGTFRLPANPGTYDLEVLYTGYASSHITGVKILAKKINYADFVLNEGAVLNEVVVSQSGISWIRTASYSMSATTVTSDQVKNLPTRSVNAITATTAGANDKDVESVNIKGARSGATNYYIDGVRVAGNMPLVQDIENLQIVTGGLGAEFGEMPGGVVRAGAGSPALSEVAVTAYKIPLIEMDDMETGQTFTSDQLEPRSIASGRARGASEKKKAKIVQSIPTRQSISRARQFYAPQYDANAAQPVRRTDFRPTLYWNPNIRTDEKGEAQVSFFTSDAITNFRATLEGIGAQGEAGHAEKKFFVQKPVSLAVKVPASVIAGDVLKLQIALSNKTQYPAGGNLEIAVPAHFSPGPDMRGKATALTLDPGETRIIGIEYTIGQQKTENQNVSIRFAADENVLDAFETSIRTLDRGFPARQVASGNAAQNAFSMRLNDPVEGTVSATLTAYPSALEDVLKGMERMLRQPSGCFEQVSSSNYPNLLVLDLLRQTGTAKPDVENQAMRLLEDGYKKLAAYECKSGGFDWWGRDPAHEGLTAYGILEFTDMAKVFNVDKKLIDRTVDWMAGRRDGKGSWKVNPQSLHGWQKDGVLDAYIAWALAEGGYGKQFAPEISHAHEEALRSKDPYQLALMTNALLALKDPRAAALLDQLRPLQKDDGSWTGTTHSVMYASGNCFSIETTALAALALMKNGEKNIALQKSMDYLIRSKTEYGYGSTQSTVTAFKALVEYAKLGNQTAADGNLVVLVDGKRVAEQAFSTKNSKRLEIKDLEQFFTTNTPRVEVFFENPKAVIPFDIEIKYASRQPRNTANCPLAFRTALAQNTAKVGETVRLSAVLKNTTSEAQASPMVVLGIPAGLSLQPWQLKKIVEEKQCDFYELWDGFAVFHFENLAAGETRTLNLDLRADVAGAFEAPASQAFLYYTNDQRVWSKPERVVIGE